MQDRVECRIPDGEDTTSLGKTGLFLDTTDSLLEDGGDLSGGRLGLSSVCADLLDRSRRSADLKDFQSREFVSKTVFTIQQPKQKSKNRSNGLPKAPLALGEGALDGFGGSDRVLVTEWTGRRREVLTAAALPEAETAVTARLDCRRAFLNIVTRIEGE